MSLLSGDPLTQLAFSVYENKGVYALLVGSGLSRAAGIPTGWEITLDLIRRVATAQEVEDQDDWEAWYLKTTGKDPNYSELIKEVERTRDGRRSILHKYIEPDETDRAEGRKLPTDAHRAIARLVRDGYIRVLVTTNFDRLLENALREQGVEPTVVASVDALLGAEPLAHTRCYLLKLHGDYKDARILNTDEELEEYQPEFQRLLDRIIDEHGLIVCGWSGEWDQALRAALLRSSARRYPLFWAARGDKFGDSAQEIIRHRQARTIPIDDADSFFTELEQHVDTLARTHRQNPLSIDLLVNTVKRYLGKPEEHRIQLDDLFADEIQTLIDKVEAEGFSLSAAISPDNFKWRVGLYESTTEPLASVAGVLGRWGDGTDFPLASDMIKRLCTHADLVESGYLNTFWHGLRFYPAVLVMTGYGLGLVRAERWRELHWLFDLQIDRPGNNAKRAVECLFLQTWKCGDPRKEEFWRSLEGTALRDPPLSDYLCKLFTAWSEPFTGVMSDFERLFESWEILGSLAFLENPSFRGDWCPHGRSAWNYRGLRGKILEQYLAQPTKQALLDAGFANGDGNALLEAAKFYLRYTASFYP